jgi:hypothetical protein
MSIHQYGYVALLGAAVAVGDIAASQFNGSSLGTLHVVVSCIITALVTAKMSASLKNNS